MSAGTELDLASRTLEALRRSEHNFRTIIERSPLPTCVSCIDRVLYTNPAMLDYLGYDESGLVGPSLAELSDNIIHPDDRERTRAAFAGLFATLDDKQPPRATVRLDDVRVRSRRDGAIRYCDMHAVVIRHEATPGLALVTYLHDHTERRAAAEQVRLADRMSALGTLAAGVAHEINNPLTYVLTNMELVATGLEGMATAEAAELASAVADARTGLDRIRRIVRALRTFSRSDDETMAPADLIQVLESSIEMAHSHLRHRGRLVKQYTGAPLVHGNESRLGQVFLNLLLNAAQALDETKLESNEVTVSVERSGDRAIVTVRDNGAGIASRDLPRVFDAFFTTKPVGMGTGLGLFVCHGIVTALGGTITIDSAEGQWTHVRVALPLAEPRDERRGVAPGTQRTRRGRVLAVDDEPLVLGAVSRVLEDEHDVTALTTGREALERLLAGEQFDLILCDLMMPGMTGVDLLAQLNASLPDMVKRVVFMTGGAVTDVAAAFLAKTAHATVEKPFEASELLALVREHVSR